jgi:hypothetical protein
MLVVSVFYYKINTRKKLLLTWAFWFTIKKEIACVCDSNRGQAWKLCVMLKAKRKKKYKYNKHRTGLPE